MLVFPDIKRFFELLFPSASLMNIHLHGLVPAYASVSVPLSTEGTYSIQASKVSSPIALNAEDDDTNVDAQLNDLRRHREGLDMQRERRIVAERRK